MNKTTFAPLEREAPLASLSYSDKSATSPPTHNKGSAAHRMVSTSKPGGKRAVGGRKDPQEDLSYYHDPAAPKRRGGKHGRLTSSDEKQRAALGPHVSAGSVPKSKAEKTHAPATRRALRMEADERRQGLRAANSRSSSAQPTDGTHAGRLGHQLSSTVHGIDTDAPDTAPHLQRLAIHNPARSKSASEGHLRAQGVDQQRSADADATDAASRLQRLAIHNPARSKTVSGGHHPAQGVDEQRSDDADATDAASRLQRFAIHNPARSKSASAGHLRVQGVDQQRSADADATDAASRLQRFAIHSPARSKSVSGGHHPAQGVDEQRSDDADATDTASRLQRFAIHNPARSKFASAGHHRAQGVDQQRSDDADATAAASRLQRPAIHNPARSKSASPGHLRALGVDQQRLADADATDSASRLQRLAIHNPARSKSVSARHHRAQGGEQQQRSSSEFAKGLSAADRRTDGSRSSGTLARQASDYSEPFFSSSETGLHHAPKAHPARTFHHGESHQSQAPEHQSQLQTRPSAFFSGARRVMRNPFRRRDHASFSRTRRHSSGGTDGHFTLRDAKHQANALLKEDLKELKSAFQQVWTFVRSRFPGSSQNIEDGLDACAASTFASVSMTHLPYSSRNKTLIHPSAFVIANKSRVGRSFRALNAAIVTELSGERAHHSSSSPHGRAPGAKHSWLVNAQFLQNQLTTAGVSQDAAPYLPTHAQLLTELVHRIGGIFSGVHEEVAQRSTSLPASSDFRNELKRWLRAVRATAKHLKYAFARKRMLGPNPEPLAAHAKEIAEMHCDDKQSWGTSTALRRAAGLAASAGSGTSSGFWQYLETAILEANHMGPAALWHECAASSACIERAQCHPVSAMRVMQAHHQQQERTAALDGPASTAKMPHLAPLKPPPQAFHTPQH